MDVDDVLKIGQRLKPTQLPWWWIGIQLRRESAVLIGDEILQDSQADLDTLQIPAAVHQDGIGATAEHRRRGWILVPKICPGPNHTSMLFGTRGTAAIPPVSDALLRGGPVEKEPKSAPSSLSAHRSLHPFDAAFSQHSSRARVSMR